MTYDGDKVSRIHMYPDAKAPNGTTGLILVERVGSKEDFKGQLMPGLVENDPDVWDPNKSWNGAWVKKPTPKFILIPIWDDEMKAKSTEFRQLEQQVTNEYKDDPAMKPKGPDQPATPLEDIYNNLDY
jgi:hypothetical protein